MDSASNKIENTLLYSILEGLESLNKVHYNNEQQLIYTLDFQEKQRSIDFILKKADKILQTEISDKQG